MSRSVPRTPTSAVLQASVVRGSYRREGEPRHDTEGYRRDREALAWPNANASLTSPSPATSPSSAVFSPPSDEPVDASAAFYATGAARQVNHATLPTSTAGFAPVEKLDVVWEQWGDPNAPGDKTIGGFSVHSPGCPTSYAMHAFAHTMTTAMLGLPTRPSTSPRPTAPPRYTPARHVTKLTSTVTDASCPDPPRPRQNSHLPLVLAWLARQVEL